MAKKKGGNAKAWSAISYTLYISTFGLHVKKGMQPKAFLKFAVHFQITKFIVQAPLVEIGLTVWQKNGGNAKAWLAISYFL